MPAFNRVLSGRGVNLSTSRTVTGAVTLGAGDLNSTVVANSASTFLITLPTPASVGATIDDAIYIFCKGAGIPTFAVASGSLRVPVGTPSPVQYATVVFTVSPDGEWVQS
jgi:hypothetical protein